MLSAFFPYLLPLVSCLGPALPQWSSAGRRQTGGAGAGGPARAGSVSRASEALEVVAGRGWLWEWWPSGRGPGLEAERDGVVAREACGYLSENHRRAGTAIHPELRAGELRLRRRGWREKR